MSEPRPGPESAARAGNARGGPGVEHADGAGEATYVKLERRPDGVAVVRLDRPKVNALSVELLGQLRETAEELRADPPGAVVVWGGEHVFAAGADISELRQGTPGQVAQSIHAALDALSSLPRPVVAAVNGYALGGGLEVALACDLRICAEDAALGLPEILLGIIPGGGGTQRLPRLVGPARAKELVFTGRRVKAEEALAIGLVDQVVAPESVLDTALELAGSLARGPLAALAAAKEAIDRGLDVGLDEALGIERRAFEAVFATEDAARGIESFLAHGPGKATFVGR